MMTKKEAFWSVWLALTVGIVCFFYNIGELRQVDFVKAIILTFIPLLCAYPIYRWVKNNDEFSP
ncbi:hypothetical protein GCM10017161_23900 [Thalassotalea marina]|uniref:Uncharacterized protein n=1 Tax=Thalassotalea marina TaxID=1673741 RepID=A0A919BJR9_9GAMM|nr:hypothetical protein GCM10017161_23900 [Thalassotalea marina]